MPVMSKSGRTRERILHAAQALITEKGFASMSIDDILQAAHITKGGFFYHFPSKSDLAVALVKNHLDTYSHIFTTLYRRAGEQSDDPLQQMLILLKLLADMCEDRTLNTMSGVIASYMYENHDFTASIKAACDERIEALREKMEQHFRRIDEYYLAKWPVTPQTLTELLISIYQGAVTLGILTDNQHFLPLQIRRFRHFLYVIYQHEVGVPVTAPDKEPEPAAT